VNIPNMNSTHIAARSFIEFEDVSAKFSTTGRISGEMELPGVGKVEVQNATLAFAFGIGIAESSDRIYFNQIASTLLALRQNAQWLKVGAMDINLPLLADINLGGMGLHLNPLISITCPDLFGLEAPVMRVDLDIG
jgi:hypothetical protein